MRATRCAASALCAVLLLTACDSGDSTAGLKPLPQAACTLLSSADVSAFLGKAPKCEQAHRTVEDQEVVAASWQATPRAPSLKVAVSRAKRPEDNESFENESGARRDPRAQILTGIGDDAIVTTDAQSETSGSISILHGNDIVIVAVTHSVLRGDALVRTLTRTGKELTASY